ncbi:MAG: nuclear transport factor 2 family protein [Bacteroidales bacterium]|nr:nuclear transport factor 2 family protein [Bacteroidales bacterium]MCF8405128.1 nuclear transport factor 2 family protein [Bacteroidales bacterium]
MKKLSVILVIAFLIPAGLFAGEDSEKEAIIKVIQKSYIDGLQNKGPVADIEAGFHPGFELLGINHNSLTKWPIYSWIQYHETKLKEDPSPVTEEEKVTAKFPIVDVTGNAAMVKLEYYKGGQMVFTDYLALYKFEEGWKIVNKIYYKHEEKEN